MINKDKKENTISTNKKKENENLNVDKLILSLDLDNSIYIKKEYSINTNKMFSVSKKLNVPFFPDNDDEEEDIDLCEDEQSDADCSVAATEKSQIYEKSKNNEDTFNFIIGNNASNLKDENTKSNTYINDASNNEGMKFDKKTLNERFSFKNNFSNGKTQNILVNNINNIQNINIVNNKITDIHNLSLLNKKTSLKLNPGLPPTYNVVNNYNLKSKNKEESIEGKKISLINFIIYYKIFV